MDCLWAAQWAIELIYIGSFSGLKVRVFTLTSKTNVDSRKFTKIHVVKGEKMNPILSTKEAADFLGTTSEVVRRWCREGYLPAVKIGREYRISTAALVDWWDEQGGGRLDFESFYSVQKTKPKTDEDVKDDEQKTENIAKKAKKKTDEVSEKENIKQKVIERRIIRGGL